MTPYDHWKLESPPYPGEADEEARAEQADLDNDERKLPGNEAP